MKKARKKKRITLRELSQKTSIGIARLCDIEQKRVVPNGDEIDKIALVLGSKLSFAGMEEAKEKTKELEKELSYMKKVYFHIKKQGLKKGKGGYGKMSCPKCGKELAYVVNNMNGHAQVACSTENCLNWIQ